jgi:CheY-like chemotaxis protein
LKVVFQAGNGEQIQQMLVKFLQTQVVLMDINMPVMDGCTAACWLKKASSN